MYILSYNNVNLKDYGMIVEDFNVGSPEIESVEDSVPGKPGGINYGMNEGPREISLTASVYADTPAQLESNLRNIRRVLRAGKSDEKKIYCSRFPDRYWQGKVVQMPEPRYYGRFFTSVLSGIRIRFRCITNPYGIGLRTKFCIDRIWGSGNLNVSNTGDIELYPNISFFVESGGITGVVIRSGNKYIQVTYNFNKNDFVLINQGAQKITLTRNQTEYNLSGDFTGDWLKADIDTQYKVVDPLTGEETYRYTMNEFNFTVLGNQYGCIRAGVYFNVLFE